MRNSCFVKVSDYREVEKRGLACLELCLLQIGLMLRYLILICRGGDGEEFIIAGGCKPAGAAGFDGALVGVVNLLDLLTAVIRSVHNC